MSKAKKSRRRFRMLLTRDRNKDARITLWLVGCPVRMTNGGVYRCFNPRMEDDCVGLTPEQCVASFGFIPDPGAKIGVKLISHRWHG